MAKKTTPKPKKAPEYPGEHPPRTPPARKHPRTHKELVALFLVLEAQLMALSQTVTDALDAQDQKLADEAKKLDDFIAAHQSNSAADDQAIVDRLKAQGDAVDAMSAKLV